jgi:hypothetical protein
LIRERANERCLDHLRNEPVTYRVDDEGMVDPDDFFDPNKCLLSNEPMGIVSVVFKKHILDVYTLYCFACWYADGLCVGD